MGLVGGRPGESVKSRLLVTRSGQAFLYLMVALTLAIAGCATGEPRPVGLTFGHQGRVARGGIRVRALASC